MKPSDAVKIFERDFLPERQPSARSLNAFLSSVLSFYDQRPAEGLVDDVGDMLLFQYMLYDLGEGSVFEIDITRQFIEIERSDDDEGISQFQMTFFFAPTGELKEIEAGKRWCSNRSELADFSQWLMAHPVLAMVEDADLLKTEVHWEMV